MLDDLYEEYGRVEQDTFVWYLQLTKELLGTKAKKRYHPVEGRDYFYYSEIKKDRKTFKLGYIEYLDGANGVYCEYYINKNFMPYARKILNK